MPELKALNVGPYAVVPHRQGHRVYHRGIGGSLRRVQNPRLEKQVIAKAFEMYGANRPRGWRARLGAWLARMATWLGRMVWSIRNWRRAREGRLNPGEPPAPPRHG